MTLKAFREYRFSSRTEVRINNALWEPGHNPKWESVWVVIFDSKSINGHGIKKITAIRERKRI